MERSDGSVDDVSPHCQRCGSTNTKFCYYNNYSLTQPRYFCKGCRRYWTKGGSLRNVPVGGGCRKTRRGRAISIYRTSRLSPSTKGPLGCNSPLFGQSQGHYSTAPNIDLAAVYANFLKQEPRPENNDSDIPFGKLIREAQTEDCTTMNCTEMGEAAARIEETPFEAGLLLFDWFGSQLVGSNIEEAPVHILPSEFSEENCDINQLVDNWSLFDLPI
ncbi:hypothetical protein QQ045_003377 [Rhodiola kirilowii]